MPVEQRHEGSIEHHVLLDVEQMRGIRHHLEPGARNTAWISSAIFGGVAGSFSPTITSVGTRMSPISSRRSMSRMAAQQAA